MRWYYWEWPQNAFENFTSLSLPFPTQDEGEITLMDWINQYLLKYVAKEKKNRFFWDRWWKQTPYSKSVKIFKLPKILVMRLDRFGKDSSGRANNMSPITFNDTKLELYDYWSLAKSDETKYYMYAMVEHQGLVSSNNFEWYLKEGSYWYKYFGHSRVEKILNLESENSKHAYMFFYIRKDCV